MIKEIVKKIKKYQNIIIYRHVNPDYDAFGSQFGLYEILKQSFADKHIYLAGEFTSDLVKKYQYQNDFVLPDFQNPVLGIVLDTANHQRIDGESYQQCEELIKIDHHIVVDPYGVINYEDPTASSCSQMVGMLVRDSEDLKINALAARHIYMGIIGDTNRFYYNSTDQRTFEVASYLYKQGIDLSDIYQTMYLKSAKELDVNCFILNHYQVYDDIAYYILKDEDLNQLGITRERGSDYVNIFSQIEDFKVWMAITENKVSHNWRVSIRSRETSINQIAGKYNGGGHAFASGATLDSLDQLSSLLNDLKETIHE